MGENTIYISAVTRACSAMMQRNFPAESGTGEFGRVLGETAGLESYKESVRSRISLITFDPSRVQDDVTIDISDEGYAAMQSDPEYETWVLDTIRQNLTWHDPYASVSGGNSIHMRFGVTRDAYRADAWRKGSGTLADLTGNKKKSYWEERTERQEKEREINARIAEMKARAKQAALAVGAPPETSDSEAASEILNLLLLEFMGGL